MRSRVEEVFHKVADLPADARSGYFADHAVGAGTRREVESLVAFDSSFSLALADDLGCIAEQALSGFEPEGICCGSFRLVKSLGRGGMGAVYLANRVDGEVSQEVAVKLLRPETDSLEFRARFLSERQILANLSHPHIARLLDAGHRESGQPYLVMEYVDGQAIDVYCQDLGVRQKLRLILKVCSAVSYLHRNLVVHRDLKPANILVTAEGTPKLLDFGIAKLLDSSHDSTQTAMRMLTPNYASPEQVTGAPITTSSDVYSLGAVLYRLLTGSPPHQYRGESALAMASEIASGEITRPSKFNADVNADLDVVLMKALRSEPQERYVSVDAFADDLRACLDRRPVQARAGDSWYRFRRWLCRHCAPVAGAGVIIASLSAGLYIANQERAVAERRFGQLRQLSNRMIDLDRSIRTLPGSVVARQRLVSASLEYLEGLYAESRGNIDLTQEISDGYWRLARIQGVSSEPNLGDTKRAEQSLKKADKLMEIVLAARPGDRNALFRSAVIATDRVVQANSEDRRDDQLAHARKATERLEAFLRLDEAGHPVHLDGFLRQGDPRQAELIGAATLYANLAVAYVNIRSYDEGARCARLAANLVGSIPAGRDISGQALSVLANALRYQGDLEGALSAIRDARQVMRAASYPNETSRRFAMYSVMLREGRILGEKDAVNLGRPDEGAAILQQALDMVEEAASRDAIDSGSRAHVGTSARELGDILRDSDPARSLAVYDLGLRRLGEIKDSLKARRDRAQLLASSSYPLRRLHRAAEAKRRIDAAFTILKELKESPAGRIQLGGYNYAVVCARADYEADLGNPGHALEIYDDLLQRILATEPQPKTMLAEAVTLSHLYSTIAALSRRVGRSDRASALQSLQLDLWRSWDTRLPHNSFIQRQLSVANQWAASRLPE